jgi:plasmid stability protein
MSPEYLMVFPFWQKGITLRFMARMNAITIKLPEETLRRLRLEAQAAGRSVAQLIRDYVEGSSRESSQSVHALASDLAGSVAGRGRPATNERKRFRRS